MVTDTAMVRKDGRIYAFGPVVRELDVFMELFESVKWIGFDRPDLSDDLIMIPVPEEVECLLLTRSGGNSLLKKLGVLIRTPLMSVHILRCMLSYEVIHTRAPSSPAFIAVLLSFFFRKKTWWHKYAGNWVEEKPPIFYDMQRQLLNRVFWSKVTINGRWPSQPEHCLSFENPCLDEDERKRGAMAIRQKNYEEQLELCFVGALTPAKGVNRLLEAISHLPKERIACLHFVGDGPLRKACEEIAETAPFPLKVHGLLNREQVGSIMEICHMVILPSQSEGFPKVIAEGANYGCVPVVSDVSALGQYIVPNENGFLLSPARLEQGKLADDIGDILAGSDLKKQALAAYDMAADFTFNHYYNRIRLEILKTPDKFD